MSSFFEDLRELCQMPGLKGLLAFASTWTLTLVGHPESAAVWLFSLMVMDLALGLARAWREGSLKGKRLTGGAFKFFRYWLEVAVFVMADAALIKAFPGMPVSLRDTFIAYLAINEAFSCIEKLAFFGMPIPEPFLKRLQNYREDCLHGLQGREGHEGHYANQRHEEPENCENSENCENCKNCENSENCEVHPVHPLHLVHLLPQAQQCKPEGEESKLNSKLNLELEKD